MYNLEERKEQNYWMPCIHSGLLVLRILSLFHKMKDYNFYFSLYPEEKKNHLKTI